MYLGYSASLAWLTGIRGEVESRPLLRGRVQIFVVPSFPVLESARRILDGTGVLLGSQNCAAEAGAFTGEVSAGLLAELGVDLVEIGHAERRRLFGETDAIVRTKVGAVRAAGLTPLLCIGENDQGSVGGAVDQCIAQVESALGGATPVSEILLAYEPVWAIGAAEPAPPDYVNQVVAELRSTLADVLGRPAGMIYGGSARPGLLPQLQFLDGLFLGRFAHDPANFGVVLDEALTRADAPRAQP
jgi:triosephosphate isomerase